MTRCTISVAAAVALLALGLGSAGAFAHTASITAQHTLTLTSTGFAGRLTTTSECESDRAITVYRDDACDADADGDGYAPAVGDCDDTNADIHSWRDDPVNGIDDDCDGVIDSAFFDGGDTPLPPCDPGFICTTAAATPMR